jgi:hypothetical protein
MAVGTPMAVETRKGDRSLELTFADAMVFSCVT